MSQDTDERRPEAFQPEQQEAPGSTRAVPVTGGEPVL